MIITDHIPIVFNTIGQNPFIVIYNVHIIKSIIAQ